MNGWQELCLNLEVWLGLALAAGVPVALLWGSLPAGRRRLLPPPRPGTAPDLEAVRLAAAGSPALRALLTELGGILGRAVAGVVNLLAVRAVTIIGESHVLWPYLEPGFRAATDTGVLAPLRDLTLMVRPWHDSAHARGAASLALARGNVLS